MVPVGLSWPAIRSNLALPDVWCKKHFQSEDERHDVAVFMCSVTASDVWKPFYSSSQIKPHHWLHFVFSPDIQCCNFKTIRWNRAVLMHDLSQFPQLLPLITFDWRSHFLMSESPAHVSFYTVWHLGLNATSKNKTDICHGENVLIVTLALFTLFYRPDVRPVLFTVVPCLLHVPVRPPSSLQPSLLPLLRPLSLALSPARGADGSNPYFFKFGGLDVGGRACIKMTPQCMK